MRNTRGNWSSNTIIIIWHMKQCMHLSHLTCHKVIMRTQCHTTAILMTALWHQYLNPAVSMCMSILACCHNQLRPLSTSATLTTTSLDRASHSATLRSSGTKYQWNKCTVYSLVGVSGKYCTKLNKRRTQIAELYCIVQTKIVIQQTEDIRVLVHMLVHCIQQKTNYKKMTCRLW